MENIANIPMINRTDAQLSQGLLEGIVQNMIADGRSEEDIQRVIEAFQAKQQQDQEIEDPQQDPPVDGTADGSSQPVPSGEEEVVDGSSDIAPPPVVEPAPAEATAEGLAALDKNLFGNPAARNISKYLNDIYGDEFTFEQAGGSVLGVLTGGEAQNNSNVRITNKETGRQEFLDFSEYDTEEEQLQALNDITYRLSVEGQRNETDEFGNLTFEAENYDRRMDVKNRTGAREIGFNVDVTTYDANQGGVKDVYTDETKKKELEAALLSVEKPDILKGFETEIHYHKGTPEEMIFLGEVPDGLQMPQPYSRYYKDVLYPDFNGKPMFLSNGQLNPEHADYKYSKRAVENNPEIEKYFELIGARHKYNLKQKAAVKAAAERIDAEEREFDGARAETYDTQKAEGTHGATLTEMEDIIVGVEQMVRDALNSQAFDIASFGAEYGIISPDQYDLDRVKDAIFKVSDDGTIRIPSSKHDYYEITEDQLEKLLGGSRMFDGDKIIGRMLAEHTNRKKSEYKDRINQSETEVSPEYKQEQNNAFISGLDQHWQDRADIQARLRPIRSEINDLQDMLEQAKANNDAAAIADLNNQLNVKLSEYNQIESELGEVSEAAKEDYWLDSSIEELKGNFFDETGHSEGTADYIAEEKAKGYQAAQDEAQIQVQEYISQGYTLEEALLKHLDDLYLQKELLEQEARNTVINVDMENKGFLGLGNQFVINALRNQGGVEWNDTIRQNKQHESGVGGEWFSTGVYETVSLYDIHEAGLSHLDFAGSIGSILAGDFLGGGTKNAWEIGGQVDGDYMTTAKTGSVATMAGYEQSLNQLEGQIRAVQELALLGRDPAFMDRSNFFEAFAEGAITEFGRVLDFTEEDAAYGANAFLQQGTGGGFTNRKTLSLFESAAAEYNADLEENEPALIWTDAQSDMFKMNTSESVGQGAGTFLPLIGEFGAITLASRGLGVEAGLMNFSNRMRSIGRGRAIWGSLRAGKVGDAAYKSWSALKGHAAMSLYEEGKMFLAFQDHYQMGGGTAFYLGGASTRWLRPGMLGRLPGRVGTVLGEAKMFDPLYKRYLAPGIVGAYSSDLAMYMEMATKSSLGKVDYETEMFNMFGDADENFNRRLENALLFAAIARFKKPEKFRDYVNDFRIFRYQKNNHRVYLNNKAEDMLYVEGEDRGLNKTLREQRNQVDKDFQNGRIDQAERDIRIEENKSEQAELDTRKRTVDQLEGKDLKYYESYVEAWGDITKLYLEQQNQIQLDPRNKNFEGNYKKLVLDPINEMFRKTMGEGYTDLTAEFLSAEEMKKLKDYEEGDAAHYSREDNKMYYDKAKFGSDVSTHELIHFAFSNIFKGNQRFRIEFNSRMDKQFEEAFGSTLAEYMRRLSKSVDIEYKEFSEKDKNEEFIANLAELLSNPDIYYTHMANSFFSNARLEMRNFLEEYAPGIEKKLYNENNGGAREFVELLGRIGESSRRGGRVSNKLLKLTTLGNDGVEANESLRTKTSKLNNIEWSEIEYAKMEGQGHRSKSRGLASKLTDGQSTPSNIELKIEELKQERKAIIDNKDPNTLQYSAGQKQRIKELTESIKAAENLEKQIDYRPSASDRKYDLDIQGWENRMKQIQAETATEANAKELTRLQAKVEDAKRNKVISRRNFELTAELGKKDITERRKDEITREILENNAGIINEYIEGPYGYKPVGTLEKAEFVDATRTMVVTDMLKNYLKRSDAFQDVPFGAYLRDNINLKTGNILKSLGVDLKKSGITEYISDKEGFDLPDAPTGSGASGELAVEGDLIRLQDNLDITVDHFNTIKNKVMSREGIFKDFTYQKKEWGGTEYITTPLDYFGLVDQAPGATMKMFGGKGWGEKLNAETGISKTQDKANKIANNWETVFTNFPKNVTETTGTRTGTPKNILDNFFEQTGQDVKMSKTGAKTGTGIMEKLDLNKEQVLELFGIVDNRTPQEIESKTGNVTIFDGVGQLTPEGRYTNSARAQQRLIDNAIDTTGKGITNEVVRELIEQNPSLAGKQTVATLLNQIGSGKDASMKSKNIAASIIKEINAGRLELSDTEILRYINSPRRNFDPEGVEEINNKLASLRGELQRKFVGAETDLQKQIDLLYEGSPIEMTRSELEALEATSFRNLAEQIIERFPEFKDIIDPKEGLESWSLDADNVRNQQFFDLALVNKYPTAILELLKTPFSQTFYLGQTKRYVNGELMRTNLPDKAQEGTSRDFFGYVDLWFGGEFKGSGENINSKKWSWVKDVNIINTGNGKTRLAKLLRGGGTKAEVSQLGWDITVGKKNATHAEFMRTEAANQKLRQFHLEAMADIVYNFAEYGFKTKADAVKAALRHLRLQTNISEGFIKGTATITSMSSVEGTPVGANPEAANYLGTMFHAEHQLQLLNHSFSAMDIILRGKPVLNKTTGRYEIPSEIKTDLELVTKGFEQSFTIKQDQLTYDSPPFGGRTGFLESFKGKNLGDVSSILNVMYRPGVAFELVDLKNPRKGATIGEGILENYTKKQVDLLLQEAAKVTKPNALVTELRVENNNRGVEKKADAILDKTPLKSKSLTKSEKFELMSDINKALSNSRKQLDRKGMSAWDFDDTLAKTKSDVLFTSPDGVKGRLNATEFAKRGAELLDQGYKFDFSEFNKVTDGRPGPFLNKALNRAKKFGTKDTYILTARAPESAPAIKEFLDAQGLKLPIENIVGLGNSTGAAKARWMLSKFAEGYNDLYFADDAMANVDAVKYVMDRLDVKSKVQQAKAMKSRGISRELNDMIERRSGIDSYKTFSAARARMAGENRFTRSLVTPGAQDFMGLMQNFMGKGKQGNADRKFFEDNIMKHYSEGYKALNEARQKASEDLRSLYKNVPSVKRKLNEKLPNSSFTYDQAIRSYIWSSLGKKIPGLSQADLQGMRDVVLRDGELLGFANKLKSIGKGNWTTPGESWVGETIVSDLFKLNNETNRARFFEQYQRNVDIIFSEENLNKIEASEGRMYREALEDSLYRMKTGSNRPTGQNKLQNQFTNWINGSVGATMFLNMRSALLQTISATNYINWAENNPMNAAKAFANQPQYWRDFSMLWNSSMLKQRRAGLEYNVQEAELAAAVAGKKNKAKAAVAYLIKKGFTPTQIADSFAISAGGATFYRNRIKMYERQGLSKVEAEKRAFIDFQETTEKNQQSSRADLISQQQASGLGRTVLAWANTPMQYMRIQEKAFRDIINNRGDLKSNLSKIAYYGLIQSIVFASLQNGLFAWGLDEEEDLEDEGWDRAVERSLNTVVDSQLRGLGVGGAAVSAIRNTVLEFYRQEEKAYDDNFLSSPDHARTLLQLTSFSPVLGSKLRKLYSAGNEWNYNRDAIAEMGMDIDNPAIDAGANVIEALTNLPVRRFTQKLDNLRAAMDDSNQTWQRISLLLGYPKWSLGIEDTEVDEAKEVGKQKRKATRKAEKEAERAVEQEALLQSHLDEQQQQRDNNVPEEDIRCAHVKSNGERCSNKVLPGETYCTIHQKVPQQANEVRCSHIKKDGKRCKMKTKNKSGKCYYHD
jgi:hypothetical protein